MRVFRTQYPFFSRLSLSLSLSLSHTAILMRAFITQTNNMASLRQRERESKSNGINSANSDAA